MAIMLAENALAPGVDTVQPKLIPALVIELMTTILTVTIQQLGEKLSSPDNQFQSLQISGGAEEERSVVMLHVISSQSLLLPLKILGLFDCRLINKFICFLYLTNVVAQSVNLPTSKQYTKFNSRGLDQSQTPTHSTRPHRNLLGPVW